MAVSKKVRRLNLHQANAYRDQLRQEQLRKDQLRREKLNRIQRRNDRAYGIQAFAVLLAIIGFFAIIYWLAVSESIPTAF